MDWDVDKNVVRILDVVKGEKERRWGMRANGKVTKEGGEGVSDGAYLEWIADLKRRYRRTQIKAAVAANSAMLEFYWSLGKDISGKYPGKKRNLGFFDNLSSDLCLGIKNPVGLSASNLRYAYRFFELYSYVPRVAEDNGMVVVFNNLLKITGKMLIFHKLWKITALRI